MPKPPCTRHRKPRRTRLDLLVESTAPVVLSESTRVAIEKITSKYVDRYVKDPAFLARLDESAKRFSEMWAEDLKRRG